MIYLYIGEDTATSRGNFVTLKSQYKTKGHELIEITAETLPELDQWLSQSQGLFFEKKAFFGENLLSKKEHKALLKQYALQKDVPDIILWDEHIDEKSARLLFPQAVVHNSKLPSTIFHLLDSLYPSNLKKSLAFLQALALSTEEQIIFYMVVKRIRELVYVKKNMALPKKLAPWQMAKLEKQTAMWDELRLMNFYESLYRIEVATKTGRSYYTPKKALDISLVCFL